MTQEVNYKHELLIDVLQKMKDAGRSLSDMAIMVQSYISECGFLDDESANKVREMFKK